jgi:hypothetical protein
VQIEDWRASFVKFDVVSWTKSAAQALLDIEKAILVHAANMMNSFSVVVGVCHKQIVV